MAAQKIFDNLDMEMSTEVGLNISKMITTSNMN